MNMNTNPDPTQAKLAYLDLSLATSRRQSAAQNAGWNPRRKGAKVALAYADRDLLRAALRFAVAGRARTSCDGVLTTGKLYGYVGAALANPYPCSSYSL